MPRLILSDPHLPFDHQSYFRFICDVRDKWKCDEELAIGDMVDNHGVCRFVREAELPSAGAEYKATRKAIKRWHKEFPTLKVTIGNHDLRPYLRANEAGIPHSMMRNFNEIWGTDGWEWADAFNIDGVLYVHGTGTSGPTAALRRAINARQSVVMGHTHSFGGCQYHASDRDCIFGLNVGCGIDNGAYAFEYGKTSVNRGTLGCGVVVSRNEAYFVPMDLNGKYRKHRKRRV